MKGRNPELRVPSHGPDTELLDAIRSLEGLCRLRGRRSHQSQALQQEHRALRGATPDQLTAFPLAVLHVDVSAGILQAAVLEYAVDEDPVVQDQVLVLEGLIIVSVHARTLVGYRNSTLIFLPPWCCSEVFGSATSAL